MFNFCRVTSLVCAVSDGLKIKRDGLQNVNLKSREKQYAITDGIPSLPDYWAYMYFCGGAISGPWYEFKDFQSYMRSQGNYKQIPSTVVPTLKRIATIFLLIGVSVVLS